MQTSLNMLSILIEVQCHYVTDTNEVMFRQIVEIIAIRIINIKPVPLELLEMVMNLYWSDELRAVVVTTKLPFINFQYVGPNVNYPLSLGHTRRLQCDPQVCRLREASCSLRLPRTGLTV